MALNGPDFPMQFLVSRELARRQNVDDSTATRLALTGSLVAPGLMGAIVARQLAIREAPNPNPLVTAGTLPPAGSSGVPKPGTAGQIDRLMRDFEAWVAKEKKAEAAAREKAEQLEKYALQMHQERTEALKKLCDSIGALNEDNAAKAPADGIPMMQKEALRATAGTFAGSSGAAPGSTPSPGRGMESRP